MNINKISILLVTILLLAGCSTSPPSKNNIKYISQNRLYDENLFTPTSERSVPVKIARDSGTQGILATVFLKIDGEYVVWLNDSEEITIYLKPGGYIFELVHSLYPESNLIEGAVDVNIKDNIPNKFRVKADSGFQLIRSNT